MSYFGKLFTINRDTHTPESCWVSMVKQTHTSRVGFTHTHTHTLCSSQAAEALRYAVDRDYQHGSLSCCLSFSLHVTELTSGSGLYNKPLRGSTWSEPGRERMRRTEFGNRRGPHKGKHLQTGRELCKWVSH